MNLQEKLQVIQKASKLSQTEIADKIGVSFVAFNNWWTGKSQPRQKKLLIIDDLYKELTGQAIIPDNILIAKKQLIIKESKKYNNIIESIVNSPDIYDQFLLSLTYNSNRIEGSTLSEGETSSIMFQNKALANKSLTEQLEVKNHQTALQYLFNYLLNKKKINKDLILKLHSISLNGIRDDAGLFRNHGLRYNKITELIDNLIYFIDKNKGDPVSLISSSHSRFEQIHPFADGNGRVGRLIMTAILLERNIAPALILEKQKEQYLVYLNKAQLKAEFSQLENFLCEAIFLGFKIMSREKI
jgi:Fic family protein